MLNQFKKFLPGQREQYQHTLLGESLEDICKQATDKQLDHPDEDAMNQIVDIINDQDSMSGGYSSKDVSTVLKTRLKQDNPSKQWLAVILTRRVLRDCSVKMRIYEGELLNEVARVAARPSRRGSQDYQRKARQESMALLREYGDRGSQALRVAAGLQQPASSVAVTSGAGYQGQGQGYVQGQGYPYVHPEQNVQGQFQQPVQSGNVLDEVHSLVEVAAGHAELLEEMVLAMASEEGDEFGASLCGDLVAEIHQLKSQFPRALERLSTQQSPEAETLMAAALEASDSLDNVLSLYESVFVAQSQQQQQQQEQNSVPVSHPTPTATETASVQNSPNLLDVDAATPQITFVPLSPPPPPVVPVNTTTPQSTPSLATTQPAPTADDPFGLDSLSEGLQTTHISQQPQQQQNDPFQASVQQKQDDPFLSSSRVVQTESSTMSGTNPFTGSTTQASVQEQTNVDQEWNVYFPKESTGQEQAQRHKEEAG